MLLVPTFLGPSSIQGIGLFTPDALPAGFTIWSFDASVDWRLSTDQLSSFPEPLQARLREWCYEELDGTFVLCGDNAKFMNHSFVPNCADPEPYRTVTLRDIAAGEELTCDYRLIDAESARSGLVAWLGEGAATIGALDTPFEFEGTTAGAPHPSTRRNA